MHQAEPSRAAKQARGVDGSSGGRVEHLGDSSRADRVSGRADFRSEGAGERFRSRDRHPDSGAATIWTAMAVAALAGVAVLVCWLAAAVDARHRVEAAADLGALAAASHAREGPDRACQHARWIADRMGVTLLTCRWQRLDAFVEVRGPSPGLGGLPGPAARARAGPTDRPP
ncbi:Rv3654c family TadE-like protein [Amycolatopsis australiensis]|uniref:Rv3654c family TadE-like protein n=1 Tax=Amycolatopsis australiensis TaxID=546364 RepID=UPI001FE56684|nr:Rv3654c family TadE-like protein [Amycolatopsis australiensis]